jgi:hypothetical protein
LVLILMSILGFGLGMSRTRPGSRSWRQTS